VKNDNAASIVKKLQKAVKKNYQKYTSHKVHRLYYIENSNCTKRRKNQQQHEVAKGTLILHTF